MRRWVTGILLGCLLCTGCSPHPSTPPQTASFTCRFTARYHQLETQGTLTRYGAGTLSLAFTHPDTLSGLAAVWDGETVTCSVHGITFSTNTVPELALVKQLANVLDSALRGEGSSQRTDQHTVWEGTANGAAYTLVCDKESGLPLSLSVPSLPLEATFTYE